MTRDQLEFSISQYLDGTLPTDERIALEAVLAEDSDAQSLLADDRALTDLLQSTPLPDVQWDRFAESISLAIDDQMQQRVDRASLWLRMRLPTGMAMAACALLAIGLGIHLMTQTSPVAGPSRIAPPQGIQTAMIVEGPRDDTPSGPVVSEISVAAGGSYAKDSSLSPYADEMDSRPSRVVIASGLATDQPHASFPY